MAVLTLSRQFGSRGDELAVEVARRTGFRLVTRETVEEIMRREYGAEPPLSLHASAVEAGAGGNGHNGKGRFPAASPVSPLVIHYSPLPPGNGDGARAEGNGGQPTGAQAAEMCLYADLLASIIAELAANEDLLLLGCGGQVLLADAACAVHVRVVAPRAWRAATVSRPITSWGATGRPS